MKLELITTVVALVAIAGSGNAELLAHYTLDAANSAADSVSTNLTAGNFADGAAISGYSTAWHTSGTRAPYILDENMSSNTTVTVADIVGTFTLTPDAGKTVALNATGGVELDIDNFVNSSIDTYSILNAKIFVASDANFTNILAESSLVTLINDGASSDPAHKVGTISLDGGLSFSSTIYIGLGMTDNLDVTDGSQNVNYRFDDINVNGTGNTEPPPSQIMYIDANDSNTIASGGTPAPFYDASTGQGGWYKRTGFGFDVNGNTEIFENDGTQSSYGDAPLLETTISDLVPGQEYGVYVCFLSDSSAWTIRAGLDPGNLTEFLKGVPDGQTENLGITSVPNSNRSQMLGFIANKTAALDGTIVVYIDDGEWTGPVHSGRTWYEGVAVGEPVVTPEPPVNPRGSVELAPDGAWTWFNDERAIFHEGFLYCSYVTRVGGHVMLTRYDPSTGMIDHMQLSTTRSSETDDHNNCSIEILPDNRLLVAYSRHDTRDEFYYRTSKVATPSTLADWNDELSKTMPRNNTYCNLHLLPAEGNKIYNFTRCINWNPTITISSDLGETWGTPTQMINEVNRPYVNYTDNGHDRIDIIYTDGHPRDIQNSVYHMYYKEGNFHQTDGTVIKSFADLPLDHSAGERGSVVYAYSDASWGDGDTADDWVPEGRGWLWDIEYGMDGKPVCAFQVQKDLADAANYTEDRIYYYYARWTGTEWQRRLIAQGGHGLYYPWEDDYGGGMSVDPDDPRVVYISSNAANPFDLSSLTNVPLNTDSRYEIYRGVTEDGGLTFAWTAMTANSDADNLRPIVPANHMEYNPHVLWFYGTYPTFRTFNTKVLGAFHFPPTINAVTNSGPSELSLSFSGIESWDYVIKSTSNLVNSASFDTLVTPISVSEGTISNATITTTSNGTATVQVPTTPDPVGFFRLEMPTL